MGGQRWTERQIERLRRLKAAGYADRQAAAELGRTAQAVKELRRARGIPGAAQAGTPANRRRAKTVLPHIRNLFSFVCAARASEMGWPGATPAGAAVLDLLSAAPGLTVPEVARGLGLTPDAAAQRLYRLKRCGWLECGRRARRRAVGGTYEKLWRLAPGVRKRSGEPGREEEMRLREAATFTPQTPRPIYRSLSAG